MKAFQPDGFQWDELLNRMKWGNVIPVIGQGLYRVETGSQHNKDVRLYDYLADRLSEEYGLQLPIVANHRFAAAALEFLKRKPNRYVELSRFLMEEITHTRLIPASPLMKLAGIKSFEMFITTAYDDFLTVSLRKHRRAKVSKIAYGGVEKRSRLDINDLFDYRNNPRQILVYHILGHIKENSFPAYTESDIMESMLELKKDMESQHQNRLFWKLQSSCLLFLGCGFDDWLSRFFIRIMSNQEFQFSRGKQFVEFVGDDFSNRKDPFNELPMFLKEHHIQVFHCNGGSDFVDLLYDKVRKEAPEEIIMPGESGPVFISFHGADRETARKLAAFLKEDGIETWLDERRITPGDKIDETITRAIDNAAVFIPLISRHSMQVQREDGQLAYHVREWERAYGNTFSGENNISIVPVNIDNTAWQYEKFKGLAYIDIPGGDRCGDYGKLLKRLFTRFQWGPDND